MANELQRPLSNQLPNNTSGTNLTQNGDNNIQVAHADTVNQNVIIAHGFQNSNDAMKSLNQEHDYDCYNLFVIGGESFDGSYFIVPKDRALTESTSQEMKDECAALTPEAIEKIKMYPALFASENENYGRAGCDQIAHYGYVTGVKIQDNGIKISFQTFNPIPQQILNDLAFELNLGRASSYNELNRTHWAIKRINLVEELKNKGIRVFVLS